MPYFYVSNKPKDKAMTTKIKQHDRTGFEGMKFDFLCDGKYLTSQETPEQSIEWFKDFKGYEPETVSQVSKYPSRH